MSLIWMRNINQCWMFLNLMRIPQIWTKKMKANWLIQHWEVFIPSNFEEVIEVQNDPVQNEIEQFNDGEILNTTVIPEENQQEEERGEQQQDKEEEDLGITKRGTKRVRKRKSTTQKEKIQKRIKKLKENHPPRNPCGDKCRYKYSTRFSEEWRNQCNAEFWDKDFTGRRDFIMLCGTKLPVKRRRGESGSKINSFRYFFNSTIKLRKSKYQRTWCWGSFCMERLHFKTKT